MSPENSNLLMYLITIPVSLAILIGREWFIISVQGIFGKNLAVKTNQHESLLEKVDIWALGLLIYAGVSWSGLTKKGKIPTAFQFALSQIWFIIVALVIFIYYKLKNPEPDSVVLIVIEDILRKCWSLHILAYIPLPPFDASFFYSNFKSAQILSFVFKISITVMFLTNMWNNNFINGIEFLNWLNIR